jgi:hypothetical protein
MHMCSRYPALQVRYSVIDAHCIRLTIQLRLFLPLYVRSIASVEVAHLVINSGTYFN